MTSKLVNFLQMFMHVFASRDLKISTILIRCSFASIDDSIVFPKTEFLPQERATSSNKGRVQTEEWE